MTSSDKPLSDLLPSLPEKPTLEDLAGGASIPSTATVAEANASVKHGLTRQPPINLPRFTFLIGPPAKCLALSSALLSQSSSIYVEDFLTPVYDAVIAYHNLPFGINPAESVQIPTFEGTYLFNLLKTHADKKYLEQRLWDDVEELSAFHDYQFVIRDAEGFDLNRFTCFYPASKILIINLEGDETNFESPPMRMMFQSSDSIDYIMEQLRKSLQ